MNEFTCAECGRTIWRPIPLAIQEARLCATCLMLPGWIDDEATRRVLDPEGLVDPAKILAGVR